MVWCLGRKEPGLGGRVGPLSKEAGPADPPFGGLHQGRLSLLPHSCLPDSCCSKTIPFSCPFKALRMVGRIRVCRNPAVRTGVGPPQSCPTSLKALVPEHLELTATQNGGSQEVVGWVISDHWSLGGVFLVIKVQSTLDLELLTG